MRERKRRGPERGPADDGSGDQSESTSDLGHIVKPRLEELLAFAQVYRGWSAKELAKFIGRDVHNVIPASGIPKIDLVAKLAEALDWQPGAAFDHLCGGQVPTTTASPAAGVTDYRQLNREAYKAFEDGRFEDMIALGLRMEHVASSPDERAEACLRQHGGWDGLGRYEQSIEALNRGLMEGDLSAPLRVRMQGNVALACFYLGRWLEAEGVASAVIERLQILKTIDESADGSRAAAHLARGLSRRSRAFLERDLREALSALAIKDLEASAYAWERHAERAGGSPVYQAAAHIGRGGALTAEVLAGRRPLRSALSIVRAELDRYALPFSAAAPAELDALGWWCVFGAELALELDPSEESREQLLAQFTLKGHELADFTSNWALRERMLTVDYLRWTAPRGAYSTSDETVLDRDDIRLLAGAMARFPRFRAFGWELVRRAARVD